MTATPVPLDEFPIHQAPVSMRYFGTTDRNVYDRCIMQCFEHSGETELITGLGHAMFEFVHLMFNLL